MSNIEVIHCHPHAHEGKTLTVNYCGIASAPRLPVMCEARDR